MVKTSKKLQPVADIARQNEQNAARHHGDMLKELQHQEDQLNELIRYRNQYLDAFQRAVSTGLSAIQMQDYRLFIKRLDDAVIQQQQAVNNGRQNSEQSQSNWMEKRNRKKMLNKVIDNRKHEEEQHQVKKEQREMEDSSRSIDR